MNDVDDLLLLERDAAYLEMALECVKKTHESSFKDGWQEKQSLLTAISTSKTGMERKTSQITRRMVLER